jgi:O-antigen ligase/tetratricopeptide (TPR) repeat protein
MKRKQPVRAKGKERSRGNGRSAGRTEPPEALRDPRALGGPDAAALALVCASLLLAPLWAAGFSAPVRSLQTAAGPDTLREMLGLPLCLVLLACAALIAVWREWRRPVAIGGVAGLTQSAGIFLFMCALSLVRTQEPYSGLATLGLVVGCAAAGTLIARLGRDPRAVRAVLLTIVVAAALVSAKGIAEYAEALSALIPEHRVFATFNNPDFLAGYLLLVLPLSLSLFASSRETPWRIILGVCALLQASCLLLTGSRAGVALLPVALAAWLALAALTRSARGMGRLIGAAIALCLVGAVLASGPTASRILGNRTVRAGSRGSVVQAAQVSSAVQGHSAEFRRYTWQGAWRMVAASPALGSGIGSFEVAYPRRAVTAFTSHAHNALLQVAAETGIVGVMALIGCVASACAFASYVLVLGRKAAEAVESGDGHAARLALPSERASDLADEDAPFANPRLILCGLLAGIGASLLHSLMDSDWYVAATALTLAAALAVMVAHARDLAPLAAQRPSPLDRPALAGAAAVAVLLLFMAVAWGASQYSLYEGTSLLSPEAASSEPEGQASAPSSADLDEAMSDYREAIAFDPLDPEPRLQLAEAYQASGRIPDALQAAKGAAHIADVGRVWYRVGQLRKATNDLPGAVEAFRRVEALEPNNVQNLHALGDALAESGQPDQAAEVYRIMESLESGPYGRVRAIAEIVETEFAWAHVGLAGIAASRGQWAEAAAEYARAADVLRSFWHGRRLMLTTAVLPWKRARLTQEYDDVLTRWQDALKRSGAPEPQIARVAQEQTELHAKQQEGR